MTANSRAERSSSTDGGDDASPTSTESAEEQKNKQRVAA